MWFMTFNLYFLLKWRIIVILHWCPRGAVITNLLNAASAMIAMQLKVFHYESIATACVAHFFSRLNCTALVIYSGFKSVIIINSLFAVFCNHSDIR